MANATKTKAPKADEPCGFFMFKHQDELAALWDLYGDQDNFYWDRSMRLPIAGTEPPAKFNILEEHNKLEAAWLCGEIDGEECFSLAEYRDAYLQRLWNERGDKKRFLWEPGMHRPRTTQIGISKMAFSGVHITCGFTGFTSDKFPQQRRIALLGTAVWSETMSSPGTTTHASPYEDELAGEPVFSLYSSADIYFAIGPNPDATNGTRRFLQANTPMDIFGDRAGGEKVAWVLA